MTQPAEGQIQVDPSKVIEGQQHLSSNIIGGLIHDLAVTQAALAQSQAEVARLTRVNEASRAGNTDGHGE